LDLWEARISKKERDKRRGGTFQEDEHPVLASEDPRCIGMGGDCGGQVPYCTAATDMMMMMMMVIGIRLVGIVTRLWAGRYGVGIPV
jgi:hypothetical protein